MADNTICNWYIFCDTEGGFQQVSSQRHRPTTCPNNSNHTITPSRSYYEIKMGIPPLQNPEKNPGYYSSVGVSFACPANTTTTYDKTYSYDIILVDGFILVEDENKGDVLEVVMAPDLIIGVTTAECNIGDTIINLSTTAVDMMVKGCFLSFGENTSKYLSNTVNLMDSTATLSTPLTTYFPAGTIIKRTSYVVTNMTLPSKQVLTLGATGAVSTYIPAGFTFRFIYTNNSNVAKNFNFYFEHY